nr:hypothetical protein [Tanacetum cinerariifolium]
MVPNKLIVALEEEWLIITIQEELNQFKRKKVWTLVLKRYGKTIIGTKWSWKNKMDKNGILIKNKARLVSQGYNQQEEIEYEEPFALVVRLEAIRIFLAYAAYMGFMMYQIDVKCAFLNGKISKEVYVQQLPRFESSEYPNHVLKCPTLLLNNLGLDESGVSVNETLFRGMIGSLMYLTTGRPDIQFSICLCARYQANPKESHLVAVKRTFSKNMEITVLRRALTLQPIVMYVEYLKEFWYTTEVEEETKTITFLLSWWDKPLSFTKYEFISAIGLPICKDAIPLHPKETIRAGLATLGLFDKDKPTLSSTVLVNSSPLKMKNYVSNDLTLVKPHTITVASFQKPLASEVPLTSHMLKVAKLSKEPEQSLIPPSKEVNDDDTVDKSLSRASVQPVTQSKAPTDLKTTKKRIPPSSKPKSPNKVKVILPKKKVTETQHVEVTVATADATKSLVALELKEGQGNHPSATKAEK